MDFKSISDKIYEHTEDRDRMERMNELYYEMAELIKDRLPDEYKGFAERAEDVLYSMSADEAEEIVRRMRPSGEHWSIDDVYSILDDNEMPQDVDYYIVMNMMYNDYGRTFKTYGVDTVEFYLEMSRDFIEDEDGVNHKVEKYFTMR